MKAIRIHSYGGPDVLRLEELPTPIPEVGEALVRVAAASVNFIDVQRRRGELVGHAFYRRNATPGEPDLPATIGSQGVGVVETVGPDVSGIQAGDRVSFWGPSYATHIVLPAARLIRIPEGLSFELAAAGMNQGFLAYAFTHFTYPVKPDDWCLVQAAAGGLGLLICQMIKIRGGRLIGVTSTEEKAKYVREAGADEIIISKQAEISKEARRITDGKGVNVVYDGVGKDTFEANLDSLAPAGYLVIYGAVERLRAAVRSNGVTRKGLALSDARECAAVVQGISTVPRAACDLDSAGEAVDSSRADVCAGRCGASACGVRATTG